MNDINGLSHISPVATQLLSTYQQTKQTLENISPRYGKTAIYYPQSPIEEQIDEENENETPQKVIVVDVDDDYLEEISELRKIVDQMRIKYMRIDDNEQKKQDNEIQSQQLLQTNKNIVNRNNITNKQQLKQKQQSGLKTKRSFTLTHYKGDQARQMYGQIK